MKRTIISTLVISVLSFNVVANSLVTDEASLQQAISRANLNAHTNVIIFSRNAKISLSGPVIYSGDQPVKLVGNGAVIDGSRAGSFVLDRDLTAVTKDGSLVFNTAADISIKNLSVVYSATRGVVINVPESAVGDDISVKLNRVAITGSALYGLHIDDNLDEFDDGTAGSAIGIDLKISNSMFTGNGTGAIDFDGIRVDERGDGDINALIINTKIDANGGDGIELDEGGDGHVIATMLNVSINDNGFYNPADLDDGFDIDESGDGDIEVQLINVTASNNKDEGLDFDEANDGSVELKLLGVVANSNTDESIKVDEEGAGDIEARLSNVTVDNAGDDGIQFTELGEGEIEASLSKVIATNSKKYGVNFQQWLIEDESSPVEDAGELRARNITLSGNAKGNEIKVNNIEIK